MVIVICALPVLLTTKDSVFDAPGDTLPNESWALLIDIAGWPSMPDPVSGTVTLPSLPATAIWSE